MVCILFKSNIKLSHLSLVKLSPPERTSKPKYNKKTGSLTEDLVHNQSTAIELYTDANYSIV